jgi:hypothetical protein
MRKYDKLYAAIKNKKEISPTTQPGAPESASVTMKERIRPGDKTAV